MYVCFWYCEKNQPEPNTRHFPRNFEKKVSWKVAGFHICFKISCEILQEAMAMMMRRAPNFLTNRSPTRKQRNERPGETTIPKQDFWKTFFSKMFVWFRISVEKVANLSLFFNFWEISLYRNANPRRSVPCNLISMEHPSAFVKKNPKFVTSSFNFFLKINFRFEEIIGDSGIQFFLNNEKWK